MLIRLLVNWLISIGTCESVILLLVEKPINGLTN